MASAYAQSLCVGPTPVHSAIAECEAILASDLRHKQSEALIRNALACLVALNGEFDRARTLCREARAILTDLGASVLSATVSLYLARVELLAGAPAAAEDELRAEHERLVAIGEVFFRTSVQAVLAQALYAQGRHDEAETFIRESQQLATEDDVEVASLCRSTYAKVLAHRGEFVEAVRLADEAVKLIPTFEAPLMGAEALIDLAEVYAAAGDTRGARNALEEARKLAEIKEMGVPLARIDTLLDGLSRVHGPARLVSPSSPSQPQ